MVNSLETVNAKSWQLIEILKFYWRLAMGSTLLSRNIVLVYRKAGAITLPIPPH